MAYDVSPVEGPSSNPQKGAGMVEVTPYSAASDTMARARAALREVVPDLAALVRSIPDPAAASIGTWTAADVAAHLSHNVRVDTDAIAGRPVPAATVTKAGIAEATGKLLAEDRERDLAALADRIEALADEFEAVASRTEATTVAWLQGVRLAPSAVACHLLNECLIHGHDIASTTGRPWPIHPRHAVLALEGGVFPLIAALPPAAFLNEEKAGSFRARIEVRLRGGRRTVMVVDRGSLTLEAAGAAAVDARISADPRALMLVLIGREGIWKPLLGGRLAGWGRRPWKLARLLRVMSLP